MGQKWFFWQMTFLFLRYKARARYLCFSFVFLFINLHLHKFNFLLYGLSKICHVDIEYKKTNIYQLGLFHSYHVIQDSMCSSPSQYFKSPLAPYAILSLNIIQVILPCFWCKVLKVLLIYDTRALFMVISLNTD